MSKHRTILITGAFGQVGRRCAAIMLGRGHTVVGVDLRTDRTVAAAGDLASMTGLSGTLVPAYLDLLDTTSLRAVVDEYRPTAVIHLAAIVSPVCYSNPQRARRVNVDGTRNLLDAVAHQPDPPVFVFASSSAVYGSRSPKLHPERVTTETPVNPIECYGADKVESEISVTQSGLRYAILRLGGVLSPDNLGVMSPEYFVLLRAIPRDNRLHCVDARDAALALSNATELKDADLDAIYLIGGDDSYAVTHSEMQDELTAVTGLGRLGPSTNLPGDPDDEAGWSFTDWFDTSESQRVLRFQQHRSSETMRWGGDSIPRGQRVAMQVVGPVLRPLARFALALQRGLERRGQYAEPWRLIAKKYGSEVLRLPHGAQIH